MITPKQNETLDEFLFEGLEESVAKAKAVFSAPAAGGSKPEGKPYSEPPVAEAQKPQKPKSLAALGINTKGGVIRNPNTPRRTLTRDDQLPQNKVPVKGVPEPTPEEEAKANNPRLAFPSLMTNMDNGEREIPQPFGPEAKIEDLVRYAAQQKSQVYQTAGKLGAKRWLLSIQIQG